MKMKWLQKALIAVLFIGFNSGQDTYYDIIYKKFGEQLDYVYKSGFNQNQTFSHVHPEFLDPKKLLQNLQDNGDEISPKESELFDALIPDDDSMMVTSPAPDLPEVSPLCWNHTQRMLTGLTTNQNWAKEMLDAFGRPGSLLLQNMQSVYVGNFEECQAVKTADFSGQYCLSKIKIASVFNPLTQKQGLELELGICMPSSCSMTDSKNMLNSTVSSLTNNTAFVTGGTCQKPEIPFDTKSILALSVISVLAAFVVMGTIYDVVIRHLSKSRKNTYEMSHSEKNGEISNGELKNSSSNPPSYTEKDMGQTNGGFDYTRNDTKDTKTNGVSTTGSELKYKLSDPAIINVPEANKTSDIYRPGTLGKLLLAFSVYTNGQKILSAKQGGGTVTAINGIRFISMSWVILGHTYAFGFTSASNAYRIYGTFIKRKTFMAIVNAEVSVDTFFALSGTLLTYVVLKQLKNGKGRLNWCMFYFHRFWRLTPAYMLILMIQVTLARYFGNGPRWSQNGFEKNYCKDTWWWNLLYINNFKSGADECFAHAWYLANDMQFYVISPPILLALYHSKIIGSIVVGVLWLAHAIGTGIISAENKLGVNAMTGGTSYFDLYYQRPYTRIGPYLVGMYTGYILFTKNCKCRMNKYLAVVLWLVFAVSACAVLYGPYDDFIGNKMSNELAALYNALHKTVWGMAVCWVIFACATGYGGFVNTILSWKGFVSLSRLTYCAYLVHPMIQYFYYNSRKRLLYWDDHQVIYEFFGHMVAAYAVAFVASLAFESPMMGIEKVIFKRDKKK